ncbi:28S ribosomal protein S21, mitochondrial [Armadillidium vulgare]|nr:28S ribosomal protein S21, mitochondrial [Armadillidium vulgare]
MSDEGFIDIYRRNLYYEKPFQMRRRVNYERAKAIYNEDMTRKMKLIMRTNRVNPWIGSL